jgi:hypothetical protein
MRPASLRRRFHLVAPIALAIVALLLVCGSILAAVCAPAVFAESAAVSVSTDQSLSVMGKAVTVTVEGQVSQSLVGSRLVLSLRGPVVPSQVGQSQVDAKSVKEITKWLGTVSGTTGTDKSTATTLNPTASGTAKDLAAGKLKATVTIPGTSPSEPGAYLVSVEVRAGTKVLAQGSMWMGKVAIRKTPLDVSFVLPVSLGIHRDWTGRFFDKVLENATLPVASKADTLRGLVPMLDSLSQWRLTLAVEPILLTQLRDMSDGYTFGDSTGSQTEVDRNDLAAQNAGAMISDLAGLAARDSVEVLASPYTGADLGLLAAEGWRDGLEQIQMGKQELQSTLLLAAPLTGAYAPDLSITAKSLGYYADASVDHVVVDSDVQGSLAETLAPGTVAVRAENLEGDRVTLVFVPSGISAALGTPWDANVFSAALAADLATTPRSALVIAPTDVFGQIPLQYLQKIGGILTSQLWIQTRKLQDLLSAHSPDSRPVLLQDTTPQPQGYIQARLMGSVRQAHVPVSDLAGAADATKSAVEEAYQFLYVAESRWWSRPGTSPAEATLGLEFARQARTGAEHELSKVRFVNADSPLISSGAGTVHLAIENGTDYQVKAEIRLAGEGLGFPDGDKVAVELQPGRNDVQMKVTSSGRQQKITGSLLVGTTVVDELTHTLRSVGVWEILPWVLAVVGLLAFGGGYLLVRRRLRKVRSAGSE